MKVKKISMLMSTIVLAVSLTGCSGNNTSAAGEEAEQLKTQIAKLQEENKQLTEENNKLKEAATAVTTASEEEPEKAQSDNANPAGEETKAIVKGQPLVLDGVAEYTVTKTSFTKKIVPSKPGTFYTYYEAKEPDTTYLAITLKVKNLGGSGKGADTFADITVKYDNQYEYRTSSTIENKGGEDFTYTNITSVEPLKYGTLVFFATVPTEVQTSDKPLYADINIEGQSYRYTIR
ncbi:bZIP transcription factor [Paenibacillus sp. NPDC058177]|uniref:bZIP transcription factor n=1 Tax=Paenibacillus sp. NPDC058177 TaxID=3346369 RepID=UPI0036D90198